MPRPKTLSIFTRAPAHSPEAVDERMAGIDAFLEWANLARTGETSLSAAVQADAALTAFSEGRFHVPFTGLSEWAVLAGRNILNSLRDSHWHLQPCPFCKRWLLAKDQRRRLCRRAECVRAMKRQQRALQRKARRDLDRGAAARARTF
jgi:hypothetical protein